VCRQRLFLAAKQTSDDDAGNAISVHGPIAQHADEPEKCRGNDRGLWELVGQYALDHGIVDELFLTTYRIRKFRYE
jgi:hypothetical protein